ncbi:MAG TPA: hypothetical protein VKO83_13625 [Steroidobacteraceae bacterium]|nr:hypothetical protein [Steroidobacteraceae bacterium]
MSAGRRQFLQGSVVLTGAGALLAAGHAAQASAALLAASGASVVLHDPRLPIDGKVAASLEAAGARFIALAGDPVRLWRGAQRELLAHRATRLFGVTHWPDFLIVRGLAAETRRHVRHESLDPATGVMTWLIA